MKSELLFLAHRIPFPPNRGDKIRSFNILRHLARDARIHLACFADDRDDAGNLAGLRQILGDSLAEAHVEVRHTYPLQLARALVENRPLSVAMFHSSSMRAFVDGLLARRCIRTVFAFSSQMAQFAPDGRQCRFIMDFVDVDSAKFADYGAHAKGLKSWLYRREGRTLLDFEKAVSRRADVSLFVSPAEAQLFASLTGGNCGDLMAVGNGIDLRFYDPQADFARLGAAQRGQAPLILFTGQMDYRPNIEAVTGFAHRVMPLVRNRLPEARFAIVGRQPTREVRRLDGLNGTFVTGAVPDIRTWLAAANVVVAPLTIARGVQNKVLEAMAMEKPVVASSAAFEGIEADPDRELLVADSPDEQAAAVIALLTDEVRASCRAGAARRRIETSYSWDARLAPLAPLLDLSAMQVAA